MVRYWSQPLDGWFCFKCSSTWEEHRHWGTPQWPKNMSRGTAWHGRTEHATAGQRILGCDRLTQHRQIIRFVYYIIRTALSGSAMTVRPTSTVTLRVLNGLVSVRRRDVLPISDSDRCAKGYPVPLRSLCLAGLSQCKAVDRILQETAQLP